MTRERVLALLQQIAAGALDPAAALDRLALEPVEALPFATIDHHRALRQGFPEVILGQGKTEAQVLAIAQCIAERGDGFLVTRTDESVRRALAARFEGAVVNDMGRTVHLPASAPSSAGQARATTGPLLIVTAGTSDLPVAEEAAATASALGLAVARLSDVGVAGLHRILGRGSELLEARAVIVVAGMDGALPSVVGGLVRRPVIAVPTSVGYGASFGGIAALLSMLNSCAAGVTVVNIDNGFGAAMAAARILAD
jgi:NCAIR mutase (PurE)-related protein